MAQYIPGSSVTLSASLSALARAPIPDDADVQTSIPSICVDYLSHEWQEEDVWASWRNMTRHKNEISNGVRLENASWRTWWKQRNKLRTISPETLNWLKDSDVTWLYGPLHTAAEPVPPPKVASTEERVGLVKPLGKKTILKHRTISDMLNVSMPSSPVLEAVGMNYSGSNKNSTENSPERPLLAHTKSDTSMLRHASARIDVNPQKLLGPTPDIILIPPIARSSSDSDESPRPPSDSEGSTTSTRRHISFNTFVEQCIAVEKPRNFGFAGSSSDEDDEDDDEDGYGRADDFLQMRRSRNRNHSRPNARRDPSSDKEHITIAPIPPTVLKTMGVFPAPSPAVVFVPPQNATFSGMGEQLMGAAPSLSEWQHEASSGGGGFDYFNGADFGAGDEYDVPTTRVHSRSSRTQSYSDPATGLKVNTVRIDTASSKTDVPEPASPPPGEALDAIINSYRKSSPPGSSASTSTSTATATPVPTPGTTMHSAPIKIPGRSILKNAHEVQSSPPVGVEPTTTALLKAGSSVDADEPTARGRSSARAPVVVEERQRSSSRNGTSPVPSLSPQPSRPGSKSSASPPVSVSGASKSPSQSSPLRTVKVARQQQQQPPQHSSLSPDARINIPSSGGSSIASGPCNLQGTAEPGRIPRSPISKGEDGVFHSTNPTPLNSPVISMKSFNAARPVSPTSSTSTARGSGSSRENGEEGGTLVGRAAEIVSSARGLIGSIWNVAGEGARERVV